MTSIQPTLIGTTSLGEKVTIAPRRNGRWEVLLDGLPTPYQFDTEIDARADAEYYVPATIEHSVFVAEHALLAR